MDSFDQVAEWYDLLAGGPARVEREAPLLRRALGSGRRVLDLACGTGLHARFFADAGADVTAVDISPAMLNAARALRNHPAIQWREGSMTDPPAGTWDLILCLGNSLALLRRRAEVLQFFTECAKRLTPGGALLIQLLNGAGTQWREPRTREVQATLGGRNIVMRKHWTFLRSGDDCLEVRLSVERFEKGADCAADRMDTLLNLWYPAYLQSCGTQAELVLEHQWGGMREEPYDAAESTDCVMLWRQTPSKNLATAP